MSIPAPLSHFLNRSFDNIVYVQTTLFNLVFVWCCLLWCTLPEYFSRGRHYVIGTNSKSVHLFIISGVWTGMCSWVVFFWGGGVCFLSWLENHTRKLPDTQTSMTVLHFSTNIPVKPRHANTSVLPCITSRFNAVWELTNVLYFYSSAIKYHFSFWA